MGGPTVLDKVFCVAFLGIEDTILYYVALHPEVSLR